MKLISELVVSSQASSIELTNIDQSYSHLQILGIGSMASNGFVGLQINGQSGIYGVQSFEHIGDRAIKAYHLSGFTRPYINLTGMDSIHLSNTGFAIETVIPNYSKTLLKNVHTHFGLPRNGQAEVDSRMGQIIGSGTDQNPVTSLRFLTSSGGLNVGTKFSIYGW